MNVTQILGKSYATAKSIGVRIGTKQNLPVSTSNSGGTAVVEFPPTVARPANINQAISQQIDSSTQLEENTETTNGTGNGGKSIPVTSVKTPKNAYWMLVVLGGLLVITFAWDRGKL